MEKATLYTDYLDKARSLAEARETLLREEEVVFNNELPIYDRAGTVVRAFASETEASKVLQGSVTQSKYLSPDYRVAAEIYAEELMNNLPAFEYEGNSASFSEAEQDDLNMVFKRVSFANNISMKMSNTLKQGMRKGFCVCELVPASIKTEGFILNDDGTDTEVPEREDWIIDLIRYSSVNTYIDPIAHVDNIRNTAEYVIVNLGLF